jgi:aminocarboxymuconate-semialdehyde decarboxylase
VATDPDQRALDVHSHAMPMPLLTWLSARGLADLSEVEREVVRIDPRVSGVGRGSPLPLARSQHDPRRRLAEMDEMGVSHHAVAMPPFLFASTCDDPGLVTDVIGRGNDGLAEFVATDPSRLLALGSVPLGWPGAADEARRCLDDLWSVLAERRTFIFMHPSGVPDGPRLADYWMPQLVGYPMDTAIAVARLIMGGVLERHDLVLCLAHGGGCVPALRGRMDMGWRRKDVARTTALPPSEYAARLYYDTAVFDTTMLARLVADYGADHVLMGTDHPFELGDPDPIATVRALGLDPQATRTVLWDSAAALLGLD